MRDAKALPYDYCPLREISDSIIGQVVPAPANAVFFRRGSGGEIVASIVLLGSYTAEFVVDGEGRDLPGRAWLTDPKRPSGDPRITYAELASGCAAARATSKG